ncbi:MAG: glycogen/starch synthase, partial [Alphaproteobacteria bacterium]
MAWQRILFAASEIFPLAKTGGLADVSAALPAALARLGTEVQLVMPGYEQALDLADRPHVTATLDDVLGFEGVRIITARTPDTGVPISLIDIPELYCDGGGIYQNADGSDRANNAIRFGVLSQAAAQLAAGRGGSTWRPSIVHCNDWHTGLIPLMLREKCGPRAPATVFTVHNMMFQGLFPWEGQTALRLPTDDGV